MTDEEIKKMCVEVHNGTYSYLENKENIDMEPTLESLNAVAQAAGFIRDWAHAELHGRKEVSEAETFYRKVVAARLGDTLWEYPLDGNDREAIALIEAKFAELRAAKNPESIEWNGGKCPVAPETLVEVKLRNGEISTDRAENFNWSNDNNHDDIIAYRIVS